MPARQTCRVRCAVVIAAVVLAVLPAGCGSSGPRFPNVKAVASQPVVTTPATTASTGTTTAAPSDPSASGPPNFVVRATTEQGDRVKVEGWFGPALTAQESDVEGSALSGCPEPANDGRAMVVKLEMAITLESSLSGKVGFSTGNVAGTLMAFVMGDGSGANCGNGEPSATTAEVGTMQPHETQHYTMWLVLPNAITPSDPHPSEQTLGREHWLMLVPEPSVDGSGYNQDQHSSVSGPHVVHCQSASESEGPGINYLAVVGDTPRTMTGEQSVMGEAKCAGS